MHVLLVHDKGTTEQSSAVRCKNLYTSEIVSEALRDTTR